MLGTTTIAFTTIARDSLYTRRSRKAEQQRVLTRLLFQRASRSLLRQVYVEALGGFQKRLPFLLDSGIHFGVQK